MTQVDDETKADVFVVPQPGSAAATAAMLVAALRGGYIISPRVVLSRKRLRSAIESSHTAVPRDVHISLVRQTRASLLSVP